MKTFIELLDGYREGTLTEQDAADLWLETTKFIQKTCRSHYGVAQSRGFNYKAGGKQKVSSNPLSGRVVNNEKYEKYMTRMLRFFDFLSAYPERPPKWVLFVWRRRYAWVEQVIDAELLGVGIYPADLPFHKRVTHNITKKLVECRAMIRDFELLPTDFVKLEEPMNEIHTAKYTNEAIEMYAGYVRAAYPWLFPDEFTVPDDDE